MTKNVRFSAALVGLFVVILLAVIAVQSTRADGEEAKAAGGTSVVREDSHRLSTAPDGRVTLVEFLDFECEGCRAAFPFVEQLRKDYDGKVTFVGRYFPLPGHANAQNAALAVEAAAQQGKFESMYQRMYETQAEWGERRNSEAPRFREFAQSLGLDMAAYDAAVAHPATQARVDRDRADGEALGVTGTPTFFLNGEKISPADTQEFRALIDAALRA